MSKSSSSQMFYKIVVFTNFLKLSAKHLYCSVEKRKTAAHKFSYEYYRKPPSPPFFTNLVRLVLFENQFWLISWTSNHYSAKIYLFKVNNRTTRKRCKIYSKLTRQKPCRWRSFRCLNCYCWTYFTPFFYGFFCWLWIGKYLLDNKEKENVRLESNQYLATGSKKTTNGINNHCLKCVRIRSYSDPYVPAFEPKIFWWFWGK